MIINLTPHDIKIVNNDGEIIATYPTSGTIARVSTVKQTVGEVDGVEVKSVTYGAIDGLPDPDGNMYIVSMVVASAAKGRTDIVIPDTAPDAAVRDSAGLIVGVKNFARY